MRQEAKPLEDAMDSNDVLSGLMELREDAKIGPMADAVESFKSCLGFANYELATNLPGKFVVDDRFAVITSLLEFAG